MWYNKIKFLFNFFFVKSLQSQMSCRKIKLLQISLSVRWCDTLARRKIDSENRKLLADPWQKWMPFNRFNQYFCEKRCPHMEILMNRALVTPIREHKSYWSVSSQVSLHSSVDPGGPHKQLLTPSERCCDQILTLIKIHSFIFSVILIESQCNFAHTKIAQLSYMYKISLRSDRSSLN